MWQSGTKPRRTFIDREEDAESGLGEFEARKYEDETGRFTSIDEKWEEYREWSPYNYAENDPVRYSDPTGFNKGEYQNKTTPPEGVSSISSPPRGGVNMGSTGLGGGGKGSSGRGSGSSRSSGGSGGSSRSGGGGGAIASTIHDYDERRPMQQQKGYATLEMTRVPRAKVHGNSSRSRRNQHLYEIYDVETGDVVKTGISGSKLNQNGTSRRANSQVSRFNKAAGKTKYAARIVKKNIAGRKAALKAEKVNADRLRDKGNSMQYHTYP